MIESTKELTMKQIPLGERPYEKLEKLGPGMLSDAELLAIVLRTGINGERVTNTACRILTEAEKNPMHAPLAALFCMSLERLRSLPGIGRVKAIQLKAIQEISSRLSQAEAKPRLQAQNAASVAAVFMEQMRYLEQEEVRLLFFDNKNLFISECNLSRGTVNMSIVSTREVFRTAIENHAVNFIILHNHPSGDPSPSPADISVTRNLIDCGEMLEVHLLDHIIIGNGSYYSLKEQGMI